MLTRRIVHALATVAIAASTVLVLDQTGLRASHQFSDVGNGNFFHESIGAIGSAGCASGFNDGTFRPNSNPTRGQFAYWTHNCGGRVAYDENAATISTLGEIASVSMTAGALDNPPIETGGFVMVTASIDASDGASSTCEVAFVLEDDEGSLEQSFLQPVGSQSINHASGSFDEVVPISGGSTKTFSISATPSGCVNGNAVAEAALTVLYVPFDGSGQGGGAAGAAESRSEPEPEPERG